MAQIWLRGRLARTAAASFCLGLLLTLLAWEVLTRTLLFAVNAQLMGRARWASMETGPGTLRFLDVEIVDDRGDVVVHAPEMDVRYDPWAFVGAWSPLATIQEVVVDQVSYGLGAYADRLPAVAAAASRGAPRGPTSSSR